MPRDQYRRKPTGYVYIIHLNTPLHHARHYIGYTEDIEERVARHADGRGSPYLRAALEQGIGWAVVRLTRGTKSAERAMKNRHGAKVFCPVCTPGDMVSLGEECEIPRYCAARPLFNDDGRTVKGIELYTAG